MISAVDAGAAKIFHLIAPPALLDSGEGGGEEDKER